ncbi:hypothetical protein BJ170DRAFT_597166 [Xylariales sp. AK1849]|nr:hypothetical protein BJ170DRAFT_597166 [Xylariales sp. AK1849]
MDKVQATTRTARGKAPKTRNSEARREQNRVASRAYREKRKQKLALLDRILKPDNQESPSPSSELDDDPDSLSVIHSRQTSMSPGPTPQPAAPCTTIRPSAGQTLGTNSQFGGDSFDDLWMNGFDRSNEIFGTSQDFVTAFDPSNVTTPSPGTTAQFLASITTMAPLPPLPTTPIDPILLHAGPYQDRITHPESAPGHDNTSMYDESSFGSGHESPMAAALKSFAKLSEAQQQQVLEVIYRRKGLSAAPGLDRAWVDYLITPPAGKANTFHGILHDQYSNAVDYFAILEAGD